ncbi:MAG: protease HtpX [Elusimicrobiales bacterium]
MRIAKRIFLFIAVNLLVLVTLSITLSLLGVGHYIGAQGINYGALAVFCLVWGMGGAFISLALSRLMAKWMMGVQVIDPDNAPPELAELAGMVHRLARAANLPKMPEVGIYESPEPNAFATGPTRSRALVAVSTGLLGAMDKKQTEAVLAHEISHVANGDMVTMTLLQGVINAIVMFLARIIAFAASQQVKEDMRPLIRFLITLALEILLSLLGSIVVMWFSRRREFAADSGAAKLSGARNMISALEALERAIDFRDPRQPESLATLKISGKPRSGIARLFASHPSIDERIAALKTLG